MYERNAIVLERYFNQMFGYNMKSNLKTNFKDYCELIECLEKYKDITEEEEKIIQEYDSIANKIREIQKKEETLNKKNNSLQEERANIFKNINESSDSIRKKISKVNTNIQYFNDQIKENAQNFANVISDFNEKASIRTTCERKRRDIENDYNNKLNETLDHYKDIDTELARKVKQFIEEDTESIEKELKSKMIKNGEKEKIPFNENVIASAITLSIDIQKRETDILAGIYEKTNKLFTEIKNNSTKADKHKKNIKAAKSKLEFIGAIKEYLIQFLDNERLTALNGEKEHSTLMDEACKNLDEDLVQINNLYTLLLKEISKKITKKSYNELYNYNYLKSIETKSKEYDDEIKKLNVSVTVINPNYWRIEGMNKIYGVFYKCVTEEFERDLSPYIPEDMIEEKEQTKEKETKSKRGRKKKIQEPEPEEEQQEEEIKPEKSKGKSKLNNKKDDVKAEIDKKIDMILGFEEEKEDDEYEENENYYDEEDNDEYEEDENKYDEEYEENEDDYDEEYEEEYEENEDDYDEEYEEEYEENEDDYDDEEYEEEYEENEDDYDEEYEEEYEENEDDYDEEYENDYDEEYDEEYEENDYGVEQDEEEYDEEDDEYEYKPKYTKNTIKSKKANNNNDSGDDGADFDIWGNSIKGYDWDEDEEEESIQPKRRNIRKSKNSDDAWENEFIRIDKKNKDKTETKKKKGFFDKFKK